jgi:hypothetical protein
LLADATRELGGWGFESGCVDQGVGHVEQ